MADEKAAALSGDVKPVARVRVGLSLFATFALLQSPVGAQAGASVLDDPSGHKAVASIGSVSVMNPRTFRSTGANFTQGHREGDRTESSQSSLSPAFVREVKSYLKKQFKERGIDRELLKIVLARVDLMANAEIESIIDRHYPTVRAFPSVAQQILWHHALVEIAQDFRRTYPSTFKPLRSGLFIGDHHGKLPPSVSLFLMRVPNIIEGAQGEFTSLMQALGISAEFGYPYGTIKKPRSWTGPLRISPTGIEEVDLKVAKFVEAHAPHWPSLDGKSFPSSPESENVFLPKLGLTGNASRRLMSCAKGLRCTSLDNVTRWRSFRSDAEVKQTDFGFFRNIYLLNPYGENFSTVVQVDSTGQVVAGFATFWDPLTAQLGNQSYAVDIKIASVFTQLSHPFDPSINREIGMEVLKIK